MIRPYSLAVRSISLVLAIAALLEPGGRTVDEGIHTVYLMDTSASMEPEQISEIITFVTASVEDLAPPDTASLVTFSAEPEILQEPVSSAGDIHSVLEGWSASMGDASLTTVPTSVIPSGRGYSRYGPALAAATALLPDTGDRRIVLLSDGLPTDITTAGELPPLGDGLRVSTVFTPVKTPFPEVRIARLSAPPQAAPGDVYDLSVTIESNLNTSVVLTIDQDGMDEFRDILPVVPGMQTYTYRRTARSSAPVIATIHPDLDRLRENNSSQIRVLLREARSVLYVRQRGENNGVGPPPLVQALSLQDYAVTVMDATVLVGGGGTLLPYELVILDDIPSTELPLPAMAALDRYTRQGGGVIIIGGPSSFGSGAYAHTPLEALLPVSFDITSRVQIPSLAILFLVDKSGSMRGTHRGVSKLDLVKEAVLASMEVLQPNQVVGLLSFDADAEWTIPFTSATQRETIIKDVTTLTPGGGTVLAQAMERALSAMNKIETSGKHVILLSDGLTREADFDAITNRFREAEITVSTVSIGQEADQELLEGISRIGGGRSYHAEEPDEIPRIFARETGIVARNSVVAETFFPVPGESSMVLSGIDPFDIPPLGGFVLTYPKATARMILEAPGGQPLLAWWQHGMGRVASLTSDISGPWGHAWAEWSLLPQLAGQLAEVTVRTSDDPGVSVSIFQDETVSTVSVSLIDKNGSPRHPADQVLLHAVLPDLQEATLPMAGTGPGQLEQSLATEIPGTYLFTIREGDRPLTSFSHSRPYSPEYAMRPPDSSLLEDIARKGGGIAVSVEESAFPEDRLPLRSHTNPARRELWPLLLALAVILFVLETLGSALYRRRH